MRASAGSGRAVVATLGMRARMSSWVESHNRAQARERGTGPIRDKKSALRWAWRRRQAHWIWIAARARARETE